MVTNVDVLHDLENFNTDQRLIIEIIGPAGSGKSSLYNALRKNNSDFTNGILPPVWDASYRHFYIKNIILLLPTIIHLYQKGDRLLTRRELAWMAMLNGWPGILRKNNASDHHVLLLDQGPIFLMAALYGFGPQSLHCAGVQRWWKNVFMHWKKVLDVIIWLDAPDDILIQRIRDREQNHIMKGKSDAEIIQFLKKYREVYEYIMDIIFSGNPKMQILRFNTSENSVNEIATVVYSKIDLHEYQISNSV